MRSKQNKRHNDCEKYSLLNANRLASESQSTINSPGYSINCHGCLLLVA